MIIIGLITSTSALSMVVNIVLGYMNFGADYMIAVDDVCQEWFEIYLYDIMLLWRKSINNQFMNYLQWVISFFLLFCVLIIVVTLNLSWIYLSNWGITVLNYCVFCFVKLSKTTDSLSD